MLGQTRLAAKGARAAEGLLRTRRLIFFAASRAFPRVVCYLRLTFAPKDGWQELSFLANVVTSPAP